MFKKNMYIKNPVSTKKQFNRIPFVTKNNRTVPYKLTWYKTAADCGLTAGRMPLWAGRAVSTARIERVKHAAWAKPSMRFRGASSRAERGQPVQLYLSGTVCSSWVMSNKSFGLTGPNKRVEHKASGANGGQVGHHQRKQGVHARVADVAPIPQAESVWQGSLAMPNLANTCDKQLSLNCCTGQI